MENEQIDVMAEIRKLEQAQADYRIQEQRKSLTEYFEKTPEFSGAFVNAHIREFLGEETPGGLSPVLSKIGAEIVDNVDIANEDVEKVFWKREENAAQEFRALLGNVQQAYTDAELKLEADSSFLKNAFESDRKTALESMGRFMSETQLTGGIATTREELLSQVQDSLRSNDTGTLLFWERNLSKILKKLPVNDPKDLAMNSKIAAVLESKLEAKRGTSAREAAQKLRKLRAEKKSLDAIGRDGQAVLNLGGGHIHSTETKPALKQRTDQQKQIAEQRSKIRKAQAELNRLKGK